MYSRRRRIRNDCFLCQLNSIIGRVISGVNGRGGVDKLQPSLHSGIKATAVQENRNDIAGAQASLPLDPSPVPSIQYPPSSPVYDTQTDVPIEHGHRRREAISLGSHDGEHGSSCSQRNLPLLLRETSRFRIVEPGHNRGHCERGPTRCFPEQPHILWSEGGSHQGFQRQPTVPGLARVRAGITGTATVRVRSAIWFTEGTFSSRICNNHESSEARITLL